MTHEEDRAYCLLGIFGVHLPLIYGEGKEKALKRLRKEIRESSEDVASARVNDTEICTTTKLLLSAGAKINTQSGEYDNELQAASAGGHEQMVKLLLRRAPTSMRTADPTVKLSMRLRTEATSR
jgi:hypothetical protein